MLDTINKLSSEAALELIENYKFDAKIISQNTLPYEYLQSYKNSLQYSKLYQNGSFIEFELLIRFSFQNNKYIIEIHNTNSDYAFDIRYVSLKLFNEDVKIYKILLLKGGEIKPLQMKQFEHAINYTIQSTHITIDIYGNQSKNVEPTLNQKELLKMQAFIKESQDQVYEIEKQKTVVDLLNMFQKALNSARSARESQTSSSQQTISFQFSLSTAFTKCYKLLKFNEKNLTHIQNAHNYTLIFEKEVNINTLKQFIFQFKPFQYSIDEDSINYFNKFEILLPQCEPIKIYLMIECAKKNGIQNYLTIFTKCQTKIGVEQIQLLKSFGQLIMNYI